MRNLRLICIALWLGALTAGLVRADTFTLNDGQTLTGDVVSFTEQGVVVRLPDGKYSPVVPWTQFSQDDLRKMSNGNAKLAALAEPFIEISQEEKALKTQVDIKPVPRLQQPERRSLLGAMFSTGIGLFIVLVLYAGNIYAAYEVAVFRAQPVGLVCGVAAVAPLAGPIIFLAMPTRMKHVEEEQALTEVPEPQAFAVPLPPPEAQAAPTAGNLRLSQAEAPSRSGSIPQTQVFQRGAFTFNRRFFETKFSGFFGVVRRAAEKDMQLVVKASRGTFAGERITRITANEMHLEVIKGDASTEVMVPFSEIQEVQLKHKNA